MCPLQKENNIYTQLGITYMRQRNAVFNAIRIAFEPAPWKVCLPLHSSVSHCQETPPRVRVEHCSRHCGRKIVIMRKLTVRRKV